MGQEVGTGYVPIKPDAAGFGNELEGQLDREGGPAATRSAGKMQKAMAGVFAAGAGVLAKSVLDFGGFEKQMNEVFTLLPGISGAAMDTMTEQVKEFSGEFGVLPKEVVPALYQALSAGVPKDNVFTFLETAQKLAKGGVTDLTIAVDGLSSVVNAYGADILPAATASDLMFTTVKLGKTTIEELSGALFQVTPTAAGIGIAFGDVTAALAAMTLQGVPTSVATTQLRQLFVELSKSGSETASTFEGLAGKSFRQFIAEGGNVQQALQLMEKEAGATGLSISDMFGSVEAGSAALALTGGGTEAFTNAMLGMQDSAGATQTAFETMDQGLGATFDKLKAKFAVVMLNIGEAIAPTIGAIGSVVMAILDGFSKIPGPIQAVVVIVGTLGAGIAAFAGPILKAITLFSKLGKVFSLLAANPWVLIVAAIITLAILIIKNWDKIKAVLGATWEWIKGALSSLASFFTTIWNAISGAVSAAWDAITSVITGAIGVVVGLVTGLGNTASAIFNGIASTLSAVWSTITSALTGAWTTIQGVLTGAWNAIQTALSAAWTLITTTLETAIGTVRTIIEGLSSFLTGIFTTITGAITTAWTAVSTITGEIWGGISSFVSGAVSGIISFMTGIPGAIAGAFSTLANIISWPFTAAFNAIKSLWNSTIGGFKFSVPDWIPFVGGKSFSIPRMAQGGVLTGPQVFMGGEYPGAKRNPEIVAPQRILRETVTEALKDHVGRQGKAAEKIDVHLNITGGIYDMKQLVAYAEPMAREIERIRRRDVRAHGKPEIRV